MTFSKGLPVDPRDPRDPREDSLGGPCTKAPVQRKVVLQGLPAFILVAKHSFAIFTGQPRSGSNFTCNYYMVCGWEYVVNMVALFRALLGQRPSPDHIVGRAFVLMSDEWIRCAKCSPYGVDFDPRAIYRPFVLFFGELSICLCHSRARRASVADMSCLFRGVTAPACTISSAWEEKTMRHMEPHVLLPESLKLLKGG